MRYDDPDVPASAVVGIVSAILLFVIIVALQAVFYRMEEGERSRKVYEQPYEALQQLDADQLGTLSSYGWVDQQQGVTRIPIERAMALVVGAVGAILLVICVVLLQAYFYSSERAEAKRKVVAVVPEELALARAEQLGVLNSYRWIDEKAGLVGIPIERAMALVADKAHNP